MNGKRIWRGVMVTLGLAAAAYIDGQAQTLVRDGVEIRPRVYSFGEVDGSVSILHGKFVVRNTGADSLRLEDVVPGCHCTKVEWSRDAVASGDSCVIAFEYHLDKYTTEIDKNIKVMTSRSEEPLTLRIGGRVVESEASLTMKYPYSHGVLGMEKDVVALENLCPGEEKVDIIEVMNRSGEDVSLEIGECSEGVRAEVMKRKTVYSMDEGFIRVWVTPAQKWGWNEYFVTPVVNGEAVEPIRMSAVVVPSFSSSEESQGAGPYPLVKSRMIRMSVVRGRSASVQVGLENAGKGTLEVLSADIPEKCFKVDFPGRVASNSPSSLRVTLNAAGLEAGSYSTKLYLVSNSAEAPVCKVEVRYEVR